MASPPLLILQSSEAGTDPTYEALRKVAAQDSYSVLTVVSPFVTADGVRLLQSVADVAKVGRIQWVLGLDGAFTTPASLELVLQDQRTVEAIAWNQPVSDASLHAKLYSLSNESPFRIALYVGSANATGLGLTRNIEAGVLLAEKGRAGHALWKRLQGFLATVLSSGAARYLDKRELESYRSKYSPVRGRQRAVGRILGVKRPTDPVAYPSAETAWIVAAVRGGSGNQLEICHSMAPFFLEGQSGDRRELVFRDQKTGRAYPGNAYRFRHGNSGHRVEFNTDLSRTLDLPGAANRRDIVRFQKTSKSGVFVVDIVPAQSPEALSLESTARSRGQLNRTSTGPRGRLYSVQLLQ